MDETLFLHELSLPYHLQFFRWGGRVRCYERWLIVRELERYWVVLEEPRFVFLGAKEPVARMFP